MEGKGAEQRLGRLTWRKRQEFTLSVVGYVVGMGNIVHFPSLAYKNGGVVFLIPYLIMVLIVGLPMMMLEISLGQFCSRGITECWGFSKVFSGVGWMLVFTGGVGLIDYNMLITWAIYYFGATFTFYKETDGQLPWAVCNKNDSWLSDFSTCRLNLSFPENVTLCTSLNYTDGGDGVCYRDGKPYAYTNLSLASANETLKPILLSADFFRKVVNKEADEAEVFGVPDPVLIGCMFAAWTLVFLGVCRGIRSIAKVVYVTVTVPYVILLIMIIYGAITLPNATDCLNQYLTPRFDRLLEKNVWLDAAGQALFSLSVGAGGLITLSAYNEFSNNTFKNTLLIVGVDTLTSLVATVAVFMYLGVLAHDENLGTCDYIKDDGLLTYLLFPYVLTKLPAAPAWSALFFLMMIMLGVGTEIASLEVVIEAIISTWDKKFKRRLRGVQFYGCFFFFLLGLPLATTSGLHWYKMLSAYSWNKFIVVFLLCVSTSWVYGSGRFIKDIELMIGGRQFCVQWRKIGYMFEPLWILIIPLGSLVLLVYQLESTEHIGVWWLDSLGWCIPVASILPIPITAVVLIVRAPGRTMLQKLKSVLKPTRAWGPCLQVDRERVDYVSGFAANVDEMETPDVLRATRLALVNDGFDDSQL